MKKITNWNDLGRLAVCTVHVVDVSGGHVVLEIENAKESLPVHVRKGDSVTIYVQPEDIIPIEERSAPPAPYEVIGE